MNWIASERTGYVPVRDPEKYRSEISFRAGQARRLIVRGLIRGLVNWEPLPPVPAPGYSVIIGCNAPLLWMLGCNLQFLARQDLGNTDLILVVVDRPRDQLANDVELAMRARFPSLPLEFLHYTPLQRRVCNLVAWPWVQSWLSWSVGISRARTRYALLHDFDAMLLRPGILEERFRTITERDVQYLGVKFYESNGFVADDQLATTFELMVDLKHLRQWHRPIDLFNHVTRHRGRRVDFDTFLFAQAMAGRRSTLPVDEEDMVHPSQLICQFEDLRAGRRTIPHTNSLMLIPYFLYAGEEPRTLRSITEQLERGGGPSIDFMGMPFDLSRLPPMHLQWITKQAFRLELALVPEVRAEVRRYFVALDAFIARASGRAPVLARL